MKSIKYCLIFFTSLVISLSQLSADLSDTIRNPIPHTYYSRCEQEGKTQLFTYTTARQKKSAVIYTPYGYDENNTEIRYPVLYLMHGGGGSSVNYMGTAGSPNTLCWIMDNAIKDGIIEPIIIVCPNDNGGFYAELRNYLIPALDQKFNTIADREHRAFGGFSMGSVATWNVYQHDLDLVMNFIPMCGDSWVYGNTGGKNFPEQTAITLSKADYIEEYPDFHIFAATGDKDSAYPNLTPQIQAMKNLPEIFIYTTEDFSQGNLIYYVVPGNMHSYTHTYEYLFNALQLYFPNTTKSN